MSSIAQRRSAFTAEGKASGIMNFLYILGTVLFTVYGQLIVKWQVAQAGPFPATAAERVLFIVRLLFNPWIISGVAAGFIAFLCWIVAMTRFELSYAYPFMSLAFVFVLILSAIFFHEAVTIPKAAGVALVVIGIIIGSRG
jgi:multidrug transporter EmrE-like cation transporter